VTFAKESDVILFIVSTQQITGPQINVFQELKRWKIPYLVILNKMDTIRSGSKTFEERIREKLGCEKRFFFSGALNPRNVDEWDTAGQVLEKINWVVKTKKNQINLNREILENMQTGLEGLGAINDSGDRQILAGIMNRLGIGQN
jgi:GTPase Era involved in 16S rRNA processing